LVGTTRYQGGVLVVVLISILWEGVYEGSSDAQTMGVDEGNKRWSCLAHDYTCWWKIVRLSM
jgi:hypothetical protein